MESGPQPRVLDPYAMTTPPQARGEEINPFWSTQAGSAQPGVDLNRTRYLQAMFGAHLEVEAIREKVLKEAETLFAKEIKKITRGGESSSFESVPSAGREQGKPRVEMVRDTPYHMIKEVLNYMVLNVHQGCREEEQVRVLQPELKLLGRGERSVPELGVAGIAIAG